MEDSTTRFADLSVGQFVDRLASAEPVPGGGSASAVAAALAASLVAMVASLSKGRPAWAQHAALHDEASRLGQELSARLLALADEDAAAYAEYGAALKLPRDTPDEVAVRTAAIRGAARRASEVPLACVEACLEVAEVAEVLAGRSNRNAASDLNVAALLAEAAAGGAAANVLVNLPSLAEGDPFIGSATARVDELMHEINRLAELTRSTVQSGEQRTPIERAASARPV